jgi:protein YIPF5/7
MRQQLSTFNNEISSIFSEFQNFPSTPDFIHHSPAPESFYSPNPSLNPYQPSIFTPTFDQDKSYKDHRYDNEDDELPLLDELEIYPQRIIEKSLAVLNPFHSKGLADDPNYLFRETDLAGPISFYLALAFCLFLSNNKDMFGYVYGLSVISVIFMFFLMKLMSTSVVNESQGKHNSVFCNKIFHYLISCF